MRPPGVGHEIVTLGDVLHVLEELSAVLLEERNVFRAERDAAYNARGPVPKGLWTWVIDGKPVAGYLTIGVEDVVWPRR